MASTSISSSTLRPLEKRYYSMFLNDTVFICRNQSKFLMVKRSIHKYIFVILAEMLCVKDLDAATFDKYKMTPAAIIPHSLLCTCKTFKYVCQSVQQYFHSHIHQQRSLIKVEIEKAIALGFFKIFLFVSFFEKNPPQVMKALQQFINYVLYPSAIKTP
jgi:hypothetical protein